MIDIFGLIFMVMCVTHLFHTIITDCDITI